MDEDLKLNLFNIKLILFKSVLWKKLRVGKSVKINDKLILNHYRYGLVACLSFSYMIEILVVIESTNSLM